MANANLTRIYQNLGTGDPTQLALILLGAQAQMAFDLATVYREYTFRQVSTDGKGRQFPVIGRRTAEVHTPGTELLGQAAGQQSAITILMENGIVAHETVSEFDKLIGSSVGMEQLAMSLGNAIARKSEGSIFRTVVNGANATSTIPVADGGDGDGLVITNTALANDGIAVYDEIVNATVSRQVLDAPANEMVCILAPEQYALLVQAGKAIHRDYNPEGNGSRRSGVVFEVNGVEIKRSNVFSKFAVDATNDTTENVIRRQDYSDVVGTLHHRSAIGVLEGMPITVEYEKLATRRADWLMAIKYEGMGVLNPALCVAFKSA